MYSTDEFERNLSSVPVKITDKPPGLVGDMAAFTYSQAHRPVVEIALACSLALMAGLVGRQYNVSATGLNLYIILIAATGTGKEAIKQAISKLAGAVPTLRDHIGPAEIRSDAALLKYITKYSCFVSILGEFGMRLKRMTGRFATPGDSSLLRVFLDLFNKSGRTDFVSPMIYSDAANNTAPIQSPSFSFIGETTGEQLFEAFDESTVSSGFLPRALTMEYPGDRPEANESAATTLPPVAMVDRFATLASYVHSQADIGRVIDVGCTPDAEALFRDFNSYCDARIRGSAEFQRQLFNRAHLKAKKVAALVAVGVNWLNPVIDMWAAAWAVKLVLADVNNILGRFQRGEMGEVAGNQDKQQEEVKRVIREYYTKPYDPRYYGTSDMHEAMVVAHSYIAQRLSGTAAFAKDKRGAKVALEQAIKSLMDGDVIRRISQKQMAEDFGTQMVAYIGSDPSRIIGAI